MPMREQNTEINVRLFENASGKYQIAGR